MKNCEQFVLDCSLAVSWVFADEANNHSRNVLKSLKEVVAIVPSLWPLEVSNVLVVSERNKRLQPIQIFNFREFLQKLPIVVDKTTPDHALSSIFEIAREFRLTAYDATYLELAIRKSLPIATFDKAIKRAAKSLNLPLV